MKWIGQYIYDKISRFRDDVYLEDLSTTTETNVLVVNSTGKVSKNTSINTTTNLGTTTNSTQIVITNSNGNDATMSAPNTSNSGIMTRDMYVEHVANTAARKHELPSATVGDHSGGDIYYYGNGSTVAGSIYYIDGANWTLADADAVVSSTTLLAVALGTDPDVDGMLLKGFVTLLTEVEGSEAIGSVLYLSATNTGIATITAPSGSGDVVRVLGYSLHATDNQIFFNPDSTFIEIA